MPPIRVLALPLAWLILGLAAAPSLAATPAAPAPWAKQSQTVGMTGNWQPHGGMLLHGAGVAGTVTEVKRLGLDPTSKRPVLLLTLNTQAQKAGGPQGKLVVRFVASSPAEAASFSLGAKVQGFVRHLTVDGARFVPQSGALQPSSLGGTGQGLHVVAG